MKKMFTIMVLALAILPGQLMAQHVKTVVCIGDSNTGYTKKLEKELGPGWQVVHCGVGGECLISFHKHKRYQKALSSNPDYVTIMLGTNDAFPPVWTGKQKRAPEYKENPVKHYKAAYHKMIDELQALDSKPQIIVSIPAPVFIKPKRPKAARMPILENEIMPAIKEIAEERKLPVVDLYSLLKDFPDLSRDDGLHFTTEGYDKMAEAYAKKLKELDSK